VKVGGLFLSHRCMALVLDVNGFVTCSHHDITACRNTHTTNEHVTEVLARLSVMHGQVKIAICFQGDEEHAMPIAAGARLIEAQWGCLLALIDSGAVELLREGINEYQCVQRAKANHGDPISWAAAALCYARIHSGETN
jgi:hypothetical protein